MDNATVEEREVTWKVLDVPVYGTVAAPSDGEPHPAVILLAGSGPTDRDWCSPLLPGTNGTARTLAESLARRGFVTLRYDKLGSGPHVRENLPRFSGRVGMQAFVDELSGAVGTVLSERGVDGDHLFALTNSEGAIHAVNYQLQARTDRFRGLVLTGAPGRAVGEIGRSQLLEQGRSLPDAKTIMGHYDEAIAEFLANRPMVVDPTLPEGLKLLLRSLESPNNLPFSRELWAYSLPEHLARIEEPTLVLIGKKDIQVNWMVDGKALEDATARRPRVSFVYPENANHVLKHEELPVEKLTAQYVGEHYNAPDARIDEEAVDAILGWLDGQGRPSSSRLTP
ncbi:MAG: alpha/beta hydrolase [Nitrososphaerales archaeon]|jgi:alpha-beta hydrolase superfamily lysophospholipase